MFKSRKLIAFLLALVLLHSLAACTNGNDDKKPNDDNISDDGNKPDDGNTPDDGNNQMCIRDRAYPALFRRFGADSGQGSAHCGIQALRRQQNARAFGARTARRLQRLSLIHILILILGIHPVVGLLGDEF